MVAVLEDGAGPVEDRMRVGYGRGHEVDWKRLRTWRFAAMPRSRSVATHLAMPCSGLSCVRELGPRLGAQDGGKRGRRHRQHPLGRVDGATQGRRTVAYSDDRGTPVARFMPAARASPSLDLQMTRAARPAMATKAKEPKI